MGSLWEGAGGVCTVSQPSISQTCPSCLIDTITRHIHIRCIFLILIVTTQSTSDAVFRGVNPPPSPGNLHLCTVSHTQTLFLEYARQLVIALAGKGCCRFSSNFLHLPCLHTLIKLCMLQCKYNMHCGMLLISVILCHWLSVASS